LGGSKYDQNKEELEAAEAQRQYEYDQEAQAQVKLEEEIQALEAKRVRDEIARNSTTSDVSAAEREAARLEASWLPRKKPMRILKRERNASKKHRRVLPKLKKSSLRWSVRQTAANRSCLSVNVCLPQVANQV